MTREKLFRDEAQAALQEPEQLASGLRLVNPGYLLAVLTLCLMVVGSLVAAALIRVPISVSGVGVILSSKGVLEFTVSSAFEGRIEEILVDVGQRIEPGQEIARISQPSLLTDLKLAESELDLIMREEKSVEELQIETTRLFQDVFRQQVDNTNETLVQLEQRRKLQQQIADGQDILRKGGHTTTDQYLRSRVDLADVIERSSTKRGELLSLSLSSREREAQFARELQALETRRAQAQRQVDRLKDRIGTDTVIRSTQYGIVSELKVFPGDLVRFDTPLVSMLPVDESFSGLRPGGARLVAAVLIPAKDGKKIKTGMRTLVDPTSVRRDVFGAIAGTVKSISDVAASPEYMRHILHNDDLVKKLTAEGPPFMITVELEPSKTTRSGYVWTTSAGPDMEVTAGTLLEAQVMTERVTVLSLLVPALKDMLRGPHRGDAL